MNAWGGHSNGDIPTRLLEYVGVGLLSGEKQYLHPAAAHAWRALVDAVRAKTGRTLVITEGYRTLALQWHYYRTLNNASNNWQAAAYPGRSTHGWALAVDMGNYTGAELKAVRELAAGLGWSLATGDRVREPWHLEYVGSLTSFAALEVTPVTTAPDDPEEEDDMHKPKLFRRVQEGFEPEWTLIHPEYPNGMRVTADPVQGMAWARLYANGHNSEGMVDRAGYIRLQQEAVAAHRLWLAAHPEPASTIAAVNATIGEPEIQRLAVLTAVKTVDEQARRLAR